MMQTYSKDKDTHRKKGDVGFSIYSTFLAILISSGCFLIFKVGDIRSTYSLLALLLIVTAIGLSVRFIFRIRISRHKRKLHREGEDKRRDLADLSFTICFIGISLIASCYLLYKTGIATEEGSSVIFQCAFYMFLTSIGLSIIFMYRIYTSWNRRKLSTCEHETQF
jgi:hypothetical protein